MVHDRTTEAPDSYPGLRNRLTAAHNDAVFDDLHLRPGTLRDYAALACHHYRARKPATATRVLALEHAHSTAVGRYLGRSGQQRILAVLIESMPALACRMRDEALGGRFGPWLDARSRALLLNAEVRCISRVIVHPQWRGLGLAVRLVRAALDQATTPYTEALAAMGRVSPFFEKAGMTAYPRHPHAHDQRLLDALHAAGFDEPDLAAPDALWMRIEAMAQAKRAWLLKELRRWTRAQRRRADHPREQVRLAQQRLAFVPVYYLKGNDE